MNPHSQEDEEHETLPADHPTSLANEADHMPWKPKAPFPVSRYIDSIEKLKQRGYSFAEIAQWLNDKLAPKLQGTTITRAQVYHAYRFVMERDAQEAERALASGDFVSLTNISDEEAEAKAAAADGEPAPSVKPTKRAQHTKK